MFHYMRCLSCFIALLEAEVAGHLISVADERLKMFASEKDSLEEEVWARSPTSGHRENIWHSLMTSGCICMNNFFRSRG